MNQLQLKELVEEETKVESLKEMLKKAKEEKHKAEMKRLNDNNEE